MRTTVAMALVRMMMTDSVVTMTLMMMTMMAMAMGRTRKLSKAMGKRQHRSYKITINIKLHKP